MNLNFDSSLRNLVAQILALHILLLLSQYFVSKTFFWSNEKLDISRFKNHDSSSDLDLKVRVLNIIPPWLSVTIRIDTHEHSSDSKLQTNFLIRISPNYIQDNFYEDSSLTLH